MTVLPDVRIGSYVYLLMWMSTVVSIPRITPLADIRYPCDKHASNSTGIQSGVYERGVIRWWYAEISQYEASH